MAKSKRSSVSELNMPTNELLSAIERPAVSKSFKKALLIGLDGSGKKTILKRMLLDGAGVRKGATVSGAEVFEISYKSIHFELCSMNVAPAPTWLTFTDEYVEWVRSAAGEAPALIVYVVAMSDYDVPAVFEESGVSTKLDESIKLFELLRSAPSLGKLRFALLLNKEDELTTKIAMGGGSAGMYFPGVDGGDLIAVREAILTKFSTVGATENADPIYSTFCTAKDSTSSVLEFVSATVRELNVQQSG